MAGSLIASSVDRAGRQRRAAVIGLDRRRENRGDGQAAHSPGHLVNRHHAKLVTQVAERRPRKLNAGWES
jgi:hypothetical protein